MRPLWRSVRVRTTLLSSVVVGLTLLIGAVALVVTLEHSLTQSSDQLAQTRARDLAALAAQGELPSLLRNVGGESVAQVVDSSGQVLAASPNIQGEGPLSDVQPTGRSPVVRTIDSVPDDEETETYRVWVLTAPTDNGPATIYVGTSLESVGEASQTLRRSLAAGLPGLLGLLALCTWLVIGRALRPVEDIRAEVATISDTGSGSRVPVPDVDDEIGRLAVTMNEMLDRLDSASQRQREFVADASHELRSPLAALRAQLEVARAHADEADWRQIATDVLSDSDQMERLVHDLLYLAREQNDRFPIRNDLMDLDDIVLQEAARSRSVSKVAIDTTEVSAAPVRGERDEIRRLVRNLIENAVQHANSCVRLAVSGDGHAARLEVTDDGAGVPPEDRERVFDRFYRSDASRSRVSGGTGLGLAIARSIIERHHGTLELVDDDQVGARFVVRLPGDSASSRPPPHTPSDI